MLNKITLSITCISLLLVSTFAADVTGQITVTITGNFDLISGDDVIGINQAPFVFEANFDAGSEFILSSPTPGGGPPVTYLPMASGSLTITNAPASSSNGIFAAAEDPAQFNLAPIYLVEEDGTGGFNGVFASIQDEGTIAATNSLGFDDIELFLSDAVLLNLAITTPPVVGTPLTVDLFDGVLIRPGEIVFRGFTPPTSLLPPYGVTNIAITVEEVTSILGDVNCDGVVDLLDVGPFIDSIGGPVFDPKADINADGIVSLLDVALFVALLAG